MIQKSMIFYFMVLCHFSDLYTGVLAGDEQSYETFAELFDDIIEDYHKGFKTSGN